MPFARDRPYNELPLLPPKTELETIRVLKRAIGARTALADLKGAGALIPDQSILIRTIGLQEARLSSEIENVVTTTDKLYRAFADESVATDPATKEVLGYGHALWRGHEAVRDKRPLSTRLFEELATAVKSTETKVRHMPGTKLANPATKEVLYTPPEGESHLRDLLANLEQFIYAEDDLDPLVKMAVMHYQFEAIHPFTDGNGRTGRILNILFLLERGLLEIPVLYLSRYILQTKSQYYRGLRCVTEDGNWEDWILYMLAAVETTSRDTERRVRAIHQLMHEWIERLRKDLPKIYSRELVETLFRQPYTKISFLVNGQVSSRQTASKHLQAVAGLGLLKPVKVGRETYYLNEPLIGVLAD